MKLFTELRDNSGQPAIRAVRKLGELEQKVARYRNHVVFNLRCRDEAITPPSLRLKCPIRSKRAQDIVRKAEKELVKERIRCNKNKLDSPKSDICDITLTLTH